MNESVWHDAVFIGIKLVLWILPEKRGIGFSLLAVSLTPALSKGEGVAAMVLKSLALREGFRVRRNSFLHSLNNKTPILVATLKKEHDRSKSLCGRKSR